MISYIKGFGYILRGLSLIFKKGIRRFTLIPLLINIVVFSGAIYVGARQFESLMNRFLGGISWLPDWLQTGIEWVLWPLFALLILFAVYYTFTMIANLLASPFNALLAQKVENHLRGDKTPVLNDGDTVMRMVGRTVASEGKKLFHMLKWLILLLIITVIPGVNVIAPFAWGIYGAWMLALEYSDYPMGNHEMYFKDELKLLKKNRFLALGFGSGVMLLTTIPVLNFLAMPAGVAAGTALWVDKLSTK